MSDNPNPEEALLPPEPEEELPPEDEFTSEDEIIPPQGEEEIVALPDETEEISLEEQIPPSDIPTDQVPVEPLEDEPVEVELAPYEAIYKYIDILVDRRDTMVEQIEAIEQLEQENPDGLSLIESMGLEKLRQMLWLVEVTLSPRLLGERTDLHLLGGNLDPSLADDRLNLNVLEQDYEQFLILRGNTLAMMEVSKLEFYPLDTIRLILMRSGANKGIQDQLEARIFHVFGYVGGVEAGHPFYTNFFFWFSMLRYEKEMRADNSFHPVHEQFKEELLELLGLERFSFDPTDLVEPRRDISVEELTDEGSFNEDNNPPPVVEESGETGVLIDDFEGVEEEDNQ